MSFITKRERVFNEYDLVDLPARNEGKLKAYSSCTDARAWSHFCSSKSEHLTDLIRRNNDYVHAKYVPTKVIVDTIMVTKNMEIARLRRKIEEFEQMLAVYDDILDLNCEQKCEIAKAHAAIKACNKDLDDMYLNLDISGFTEGIDSEAFETGKSRGDTKADEGNSVKFKMIEDNATTVSTSVKSKDLESLKSKDLESDRSHGDESERSHGEEWTFGEKDIGKKDIGEKDIGEKYIVEKDIGEKYIGEKDMVSENTQAGPGECPCDACVCHTSRLVPYKTWLDLMMESMAKLTELNEVAVTDPRIDEMRDEIITKDAKLNAMRNTLVIMENDVCEPYGIYAHIYTALEKIYGILSQNSKYKNYLNLMTAGKDTRCIDIKGKILFKLKVLEKFCLALIAPCSKDFNTPNTQDCSCFRAELMTRVEPSFALKTGEVFKGEDVKRAQLVADIMEHDEMKEILSKESTSAKDDFFEVGDLIDNRYSVDEENQKRIKDLQSSYEELLNCYENLKHENDGLRVRCAKYEELEAEIEHLRSQLREYGTLWNEKEHYRKRSEDLDSLKEQYLVLAEESSHLETKLKAENEINNIKASAIDELRDENISLEKRLNEVYINFEKEKNALHCKLQESECKCMCQEQQIKSLSSQIVQLIEQEPEKIHPSNDTAHSLFLMDENDALKDRIRNLQDIEEEFQDKISLINELKGDIEAWKSSYEKASERNKYLEDRIENQNDERLMLVEENRSLQTTIHDKTAAVENLMEIINNKSMEMDKLMKANHDLTNQLKKLNDRYEGRVSILESEKQQAMNSLQLSRQESQELLQKVKDYDDFVQKQDDLSQSIEQKMKEFESMKRVLKQKIDENEKLKRELAMLQTEESECRKSAELAKKESLILEQRLSKLDNVSQQFMSLQNAYEKLNQEKNELEIELRQKVSQLESAIYSVKLNKKESGELLKQSENIKAELAKLNLLNQSLVTDNDLLHRNLNDLRDQNEQLKRQSATLSLLEQELADLKNSFNDLLKDKQEIERDLGTKNHEINNLNNTLEQKIEENRGLHDEIKSLQSHNLEASNSIKNLEDENLQKQTELNSFRKDSSMLVEKLRRHESLESEYDQLKVAHEQIKLEKERLQKSLEAQVSDLKRIERENRELYGQTNNLLTHNSVLEGALVTTRNQLSSASSSPEKQPYSDLMQEIQMMKEEKLKGQKRISELMDTLEDSENFLSNLKEQVCARDDKIAIMQNQINELEAEVRRLHGTLAQAIDTGNDIKSTSYQNIDQSMKQMEAHHSKATHNIKMELAMLQNAHAKLEDQLSVTKNQNIESSNDKEKYLSQIMNLRNDKEIIVTDIKQLEITSVGDSALTPDNCEVEQILTSLDRIRNCLDARRSKSTSLEQTLLKVQTSSQLVLSKADDAKKYFEKEKQKIISEKEDAIKDKLSMEEQLINLKKELAKRISHDEGIIKDLEAEILNQKLIIDKINDSTKDYISKLKEEMQSLQELYQNSISNVYDLQEKLKSSTFKNDQRELLIQKLNSDFANKSKEVAELQTMLADLTNKPNSNVAVQVSTSRDQKSTYSQTIDSPSREAFDKTKPKSNSEMDQASTPDKLLDINVTTKSKTRQKESNKPISELLPQQKPPSVNEVQILAANVEPSFDFVKNSYQNYKIKRLSPGQLEHHSIPDQGDGILSSAEQSTSSPTDGDHRIAEANTNTQDQNQSSSNLINIYSRQSNDMHTSSKNINSNAPKQDSLSLGLTNDSFMTESIGKVESYENQSNIYLAPSDKSTDKDVLVIYRDSESVFGEKPYDQDEIWSDEHQLKTGNEIPAKHLNKPASTHSDKMPVQTIYLETEEKKPRSKKQTLKINLPRVGIDSTSLGTTSDLDKKSLDSETVSIYDSPRRNNLSDTKIMTDASGKDISKYEGSSLPSVSNAGNIYEDSRSSTGVPSENASFSLKQKKQAVIKSSDENLRIRSTTSDLLLQEKSRRKDAKRSHHKLARVDADPFLIKSPTDQDDNANQEMEKGKQNDFALEYILDTVKKEGNEHKLSGYATDNELPRSRKDEKPSDNKIKSLKQSSPSADFSASPTRSYKSHTISVERSVMTIPDRSVEFYQQMIQNLTKTLENVDKEYKKKIEAIKVQYDRNINNIINEHNQGVKNIQSLHEETLHDIMKVHENEVDNLRSMSMEAMRKADKLEKENLSLKNKIKDTSSPEYEVPVCCSPDPKTCKKKLRCDTKVLSKTTVEAFNVKPKTRLLGPCTCSLDVNMSDTIRNIFEQVGVDQRKLAETAYLKYIANKITSGNIEGLDAQELSFLHLKVCRTWKLKLTKEEALQKKIDSLEAELINKQRSAQQHMADLDRKVAEEKQRLEEVREAVCRTGPSTGPSQATAEKDFGCCCATNSEEGLKERLSAGDLVDLVVPGGLQMKKMKADTNRAVLVRMDAEEKRERKLQYSDEPPTRLRRAGERASPPPRAHRR